MFKMVVQGHEQCHHKLLVPVSFKLGSISGTQPDGFRESQLIHIACISDIKSSMDWSDCCLLAWRAFRSWYWCARSLIVYRDLRKSQTSLLVVNRPNCWLMEEIEVLRHQVMISPSLAIQSSCRLAKSSSDSSFFGVGLVTSPVIIRHTLRAWKNWSWPGPSGCNWVH